MTFGGASASNVTVNNSTTITASTPPGTVGAVDVTVTNSNGQSGTLVNGFTYVAAGESVLLEDDFNDNSLNLAKWIRNNLFSGFTDSSLPTNETAQQLQTGPLLIGQAGSHYNGIRSANTYNFSGAYAYVELVTVPSSSTKADAMFTIGRDVDNYYRIYVEEGMLIGQAKLGGTKRTLFTSPYDPAVHRYWRIRHDGNGSVMFETASDTSNWVFRYGELWNTAAVPLGAIAFELKAGTWQPESVAPGVVVFDNFRLAKP